MRSWRAPQSRKGMDCLFCAFSHEGVLRFARQCYNSGRAEGSTMPVVAGHAPSRRATVGGVGAISRSAWPARLGPLAVAADSVRWSPGGAPPHSRSEEHTSELQSLMRISYAVFCLKK